MKLLATLFSLSLALGSSVCQGQEASDVTGLPTDEVRAAVVKNPGNDRVISVIGKEVSKKVNETTDGGLREARAVHEMSRGDTVKAGDVRGVGSSEFLGKTLVRGVRSGEVVTDRMVQWPVVIEPGALVRCVWHGQGVTVEVAGTAMSSARRGERVVVKLGNSRRRLSGVAQDNGEVDLGP